VEWYNEFLKNLLNGNMKEFSEGLSYIMEQTVSVHDVAREPEAFYHGLMIGLTASLYGHPNYETRSNRESGHGRLAEATQRGINNILKIGIAFSGKRFGIAYERLNV
jgi:hypothetical protein